MDIERKPGSVPEYFRQLKPNSSDSDFENAIAKVREAFPGAGKYHERAEYNLLVFDVRDRGYTGDAAMVKRGLLNIEDVSDEGLANLEERLREENKKLDFFGAGSLSGPDERASSGHADKGVQAAVDAGLKRRAAPSEMSALTKASKKIIGTVDTAVSAKDILEGMALAQKIKAEKARRAKLKSGEHEADPPKSGVPDQNDLDPNDEAQGFGPHADKGDTAKPERGKPEPNEVSDASSPDAAKMKAALMPSEKDGGRDELLFKSADQLTEAEALDLGRWYHDLQSNDPLRTELEKRRRDFYVLNYGNDPAPHDETGRMKPVQPIRQVPEKATPAKSADGSPLADGIRRIAGAVAKRAGKDGLANAAKVLQVGLNLAGQALKVDGDPGQKTRAGLAATVAKRGAAKTEEAVAMGGFKHMADAGQTPVRAKPGLRDTVEKDVQPLFGARKPKVAAETLQSSLNDLDAEAAEKRRAPKPEPLKVDGDIGPKTEGAFASALADHGADKVTKRYSDDLGFGFG
ncbi:hypothetical protein L2D14_01390 [Thalassospiraceae bacterium LMO-JJ14]|nr:hypothetical protein L2D14_01390 [Thalassospiraceae bacterium LMO-JJ14]